MDYRQREAGTGVSSSICHRVDFGVPRHDLSARPAASCAPHRFGRLVRHLLLIIGVGSLQYVLEEGNLKDWFSSRLIVYLSIASAIALTTLVWWQLSARNKIAG